jgi:hypothetical protein
VFEMTAMQLMISLATPAATMLAAWLNHRSVTAVERRRVRRMPSRRS